MDCTCRGTENPHVHYFVESEPFKQLEPNSQVDLELDADRGILRVQVESTRTSP
jgi:hypothetical protein